MNDIAEKPEASKMRGWSQNPLYGWLLLLCGGLMIAIAPEVSAGSQDLASQQTNWITQMQAIIAMFTIAFVVIGVILVGLGVLSLMKYSKDSRSNDELKKGLAQLILGAALISLPFLVDLFGATVTGDANLSDQVKNKDALNRF